MIVALSPIHQMGWPRARGLRAGEMMVLVKIGVGAKSCACNAGARAMGAPIWVIKGAPMSPGAGAGAAWTAATSKQKKATWRNRPNPNQKLIRIPTFVT